MSAKTQYEITAFDISSWKRQHYAFASSQDEADEKARQAYKEGKLFPVTKPVEGEHHGTP